jgi:hypothetical protein
MHLSNFYNSVLGYSKAFVFVLVAVSAGADDYLESCGAAATEAAAAHATEAAAAAAAATVTAAAAVDAGRRGGEQIRLRTSRASALIPILMFSDDALQESVHIPVGSFSSREKLLLPAQRCPLFFLYCIVLLPSSSYPRNGSTISSWILFNKVQININATTRLQG